MSGSDTQSRMGAQVIQVLQSLLCSVQQRATDAECKAVERRGGPSEAEGSACRLGFGRQAEQQGLGAPQFSEVPLPRS